MIRPIQNRPTPVRPVFLVLAVLLTLVAVEPALATPAGSAMPWDTPLTNLLNNLQGTVARIAITIAIVLTGLIFAFGEAGSGLRKVMGIAFGGALALGALTFMTALGWVGAAI